MLKKKQYTLNVLNDIAIIKELLDTHPLKYRVCSELLSATASVNRKSIEKAFKDVYGHGIKAYHVKQRLKISKENLLEGMSIKQTASKCFYKSQSAYCTAFKKEFGLTPTEWLMIICKKTTAAMSNKNK